MTPIQTLADYRQSVEQIKALKQHLWVLAAKKGNLDPEVIRVSQEIDEHIVIVQNYWKKHQYSIMTG